MADKPQQSNIQINENVASVGMDMDSSLNKIDPGKVTYALNAVVENFDSNSTSYQNELGNELCVKIPDGFLVLGTHFITEQNKILFFLVNEETKESEIGFSLSLECKYIKLVNNSCLNFSIDFPIHKVVHRITNCTTEVYWVDANNERRYLNIDKIPYKLAFDSDLCNPVETTELDCNQLRVQPNFKIPQIEIKEVVSFGENKAGVYQFAIQYADASSSGFTSYYSITNPCPLADPTIITLNFNYNVGKSIVLHITNLDTTGQYKYFNLAVLKTINAITSVELVGTYFINDSTHILTYSGQQVENIRLSTNDIFEKFPYYDIAKDVTNVQDVLIWSDLTTVTKVNYQPIASQISLLWESYRLPVIDNFKKEENAANFRGYLRDEIYTFEIVFLLTNGKQTERFHIPGRIASQTDLLPISAVDNDDFIGAPNDLVNNTSPTWMINNTAFVLGYSQSYNPLDKNYKGAYEFGQFGYHESTETYPCNKLIWGDLSEQFIRHHRMPDVLASPIYENPQKHIATGFVPVMQENAIFSLGVRVDNVQIKALIENSELTLQQKDDIIGYKIVRGDRGVNKSIVAKGMLRNVGSYEKEKQTFYYPNYPYNDLAEDNFINQTNNAFVDEALPWLITSIFASTENPSYSVYEYTNVNTGKKDTATIPVGTTIEIGSLTRPVWKDGICSIGPGNYEVWSVTGCFGNAPFGIDWTDPFTTNNSDSQPRESRLDGNLNSACLPQNCNGEFATTFVGGTVNNSCHYPDVSIGCRYCNFISYLMPRISQQIGEIVPERGRISTLTFKKVKKLDSFTKDESLGYRQIFNSPETSYGQPFLGNILKLENVMFGAGRAHFVEVKKNAKYKLLSYEAQLDALNASGNIARLTNPFNAGIMFATYQAYLTIYINGITRKNYAYSFNSIANYDYYQNIDNDLKIKQREIEIARYLIPGVQNVGEHNININNFNRETSVFIKTKEKSKINAVIKPLPFPNKTKNLVSSGNSLISDYSRFTIGDKRACSAPGQEQDIKVVSYYGSIKNIFPSQWGQIYSYESVDTGFQMMLDGNFPELSIVFGGDTFIGRHAYKTKVSFFIDDRVGANDDSEIFYDEIGNIGYPKYWHSARSVLKDYVVTGAPTQFATGVNLISYKAHNFDCYNDPSNITYANNASSSYRTFYDGIFYLYAYGQPNFYCESSYNLDLRQAFNGKEGDFWPHVSTGIPDDWVQQSNVPIQQDNTYYYNSSFSKQSKENLFKNLPVDWNSICNTNYPFRAIYSDAQSTNADSKINNWLTYKAISQFDFPQNFGKLISIDGIENRAVLVRFENKTLLYGSLLTINTNTNQAAYLGNPNLFKGAAPLDFAETDLGYVGSQNKMLLKIPQGKITTDAKRGQIFLIAGTQVQDLIGFKSGVNRFITDHLAFKILKHFPDVNTDNNFKGVGLHGVYDSKFERIIISKLDYEPIDSSVKYDSITKEFFIEKTIGDFTVKEQVYLEDVKYFCNRSFTLSFNFNTMTWISFHSYIPNFYIGENNFFYSGTNNFENEDMEFIVGKIIN